MLALEMVDRLLDHAPSSLLIRDFLGIGASMVQLPVQVRRFLDETALDVTRLKVGMIRQARQKLARFIEHSPLDALRDVGGELVFMGIGSTIPQRLQQAPVSSRYEIVPPLGSESEAPLDAMRKEVHTMTEARDENVEFRVFPRRTA